MWIGWVVMVRLPMRTRTPRHTGSTSMPGKTRRVQVHRLKLSGSDCLEYFLIVTNYFIQTYRVQILFR